MSNEKIPYLCGGVLFVLLKQAKLPSPSSRELYEGNTDSHSDPKMMEDLINTLRSKDSIEAGKLYEDAAFRTAVSKYINCVSEVPRSLPFTKTPFISSYKELVRTRYPKAIEKMQKFIQLHLDPNSCKWLVKAILAIIESDPDITVADQFFISSDGVPKTKDEIKLMNEFCIPAVLVGVMDYILLKRRGNNTVGAATLTEWGSHKTHCARNYDIDSHIHFDREIEVIFDCPQSAVEINIQDSGPVEEEPITETPINKECSSNEIFDRIVSMEDKIMERLQSGAISMVDSIQLPPEAAESHESTAVKEPEVAANQPDSEMELYDYFKYEIKDTLAYIIQHDPCGEPIERSLPSTLADLSVQWSRMLYKFEDKTMRDDIIQAIALLDQYAYYISDEFLRVAENQNFLIFRNQSKEDGHRLEEILRPKTVELRHALAHQYRRLYDVPDNEYESSEVTDSVEQEEK